MAGLQRNSSGGQVNLPNNGNVCKKDDEVNEVWPQYLLFAVKVYLCIP